MRSENLTSSCFSKLTSTCQEGLARQSARRIRENDIVINIFIIHFNIVNQ